MTVVLDEFQNAETVEPALLNNPRLKARGFLLASVYDGLVIRRIRSITQRAPRPMLSLKAAHAALILGFTALNVFFLPLVGAEFWAFAMLLAAAVLMNVWVREFHRFK